MNANLKQAQRALIVRDFMGINGISRKLQNMERALENVQALLPTAHNLAVQKSICHDINEMLERE